MKAALLAVGMAAAGNASAQSLPVPDLASIPATPTGDAIRRGHALITDTHAQLPDHVGNDLNCSSCHLNGGTVAYAAPYVGVTGLFPEYRSRSAKVISLQQRINACFQRSLNGTPLPWDSNEMNAMLAYMSWLSAGVPVGQPVAGRGFEPVDTSLEPDPVRGQAIYADQCASCHGAHGEGATTADGGYLYPPVWGERSFNLGAGMARHYTAAAFIRRNMPLGKGGTLSAQEAVDVAFYVTHQPRPDFPARIHDWPAGGRPKDAR
jgi:thiosulfate dehydrogenase